MKNNEFVEIVNMELIPEEVWVPGVNDDTINDPDDIEKEFDRRSYEVFKIMATAIKDFEDTMVNNGSPFDNIMPYMREGYLMGICTRRHSKPLLEVTPTPTGIEIVSNNLKRYNITADVDSFIAKLSPLYDNPEIVEYLLTID